MQYSFSFLTLTNFRVHSHRLRRLHEVKRKMNENVKLRVLNWADRNFNYNSPYYLRLRFKKAIDFRAADVRMKRIFLFICMFPLFLHLPKRINLPSNRLNAYTWNIAYESSQRINTLYQSQQRIDRQHQIKLRFIASLKICVLYVFILCFCSVLSSLNFLRIKSIFASISQISELSISMKDEADDGTDEQTIKKIDDAKSFWCSFILSSA